MAFATHPICNRFLKEPSANEFTHPLQAGQCQKCGLVQLVDPVPAEELVPAVDWITYNEPEKHLDKVAEMLAGLPGLAPGATFAGISFKDDTLLARMERRGFGTWRIDLREDLGVTRNGCGTETIQARLTVARAREIVARRGAADVVIVRHVFEHAYDLHEFRSAVRALAKPGGCVMFEVPDCTTGFEKHDITTLWEEHIAYYTPATFQHTIAEGGAGLVRYECHPFPFENCLVGVVQVPSTSPAEALPPRALEAELSRARAFAASIPEQRKHTRALLETFRREKGKIALCGAGHLACTWIHLLELRDLIEFIADDAPHKQGLYLPGSGLPIRSSAALLTGNIELALLSVNPEAEVKIMARNSAFTEQGGIFASIFPASQYALADMLK